MVQILTITQPICPVSPTRPGSRPTPRRSTRLQALDRVLIGYSSIWPHNHAYAPYMLARTERLCLIVSPAPAPWDPPLRPATSPPSTSCPGDAWR